MDVSIQQPTTEHLAEINALILASKESWGYPLEWIELWREELTVTDISLLEREFWIGKNEAQAIVFVCSISPLPDDMYTLEDCWVRADLKGQGLGRVMFEHIRAVLKNKQATRLRIMSDPNAEAFYMKMGAVHVGMQHSLPKGRELPVLELDLV